MIRVKQPPYWTEFSVYQSFDEVPQMFEEVDKIGNLFDMSDSVEAVLNTLKLHSQVIVGVCWLKISEIAKKAKLSIRTVQRAITDLKNSGIISVINQINTKRGGKAPNVYIIRPVDEGVSPVAPDDALDDTSSETPQPTSDAAKTEELHVHSNSHRISNINPDSNKESKNRITVPKLSSEEKYAETLKNIPQWFVDLMKPYYGHSPDVIRDRWWTTCNAVRWGATSWDYVSQETVIEAWRETVRRYKANKIRDTSDDGIGGYYFRVLSGAALEEYTQLLYEERGA
jgi:predicted transcriptional regulator